MWKEGSLPKGLLQIEGQVKQQDATEDKRKSKALMSWSDDEESASDDDSYNRMVKLAFVGVNDDDIVRGNTEKVLVESDDSDSNENNSEVNSLKFELSPSSSILEELTVLDTSNISIVEFMELKNTINELEKKNVHLRKIIYDLMDEKTSKMNDRIITNLKAKLSEHEGNSRVILRRNGVLIKELSELKAEIEAKNAFL